MIDSSAKDRLLVSIMPKTAGYLLPFHDGSIDNDETWQVVE